MSASAAIYKIVDGIDFFNKKDVIANLRKTPFSMNIDECTASNGMKDFTMLVSYFSEKLGRSKIEHFKSIECIDISTELLSGEILNSFAADDIPLENLISDLSDSASYMRGGKSGIEKYEI